MRISHRQVLLAAPVALLLAALSTPAAKAAMLPVTGTSAPGTQDPNYHLISAPAGVTLQALTVAPANNAAGWVATPVNGANWITPAAGGVAAGSSLPTGYSASNVGDNFSNGYTAYDYRLTFTTASVGGPGTYSFSVTHADDDDVAILLNGVNVKAANAGNQFEYSTLVTNTFSGTLGANATNNLDFLVYNTGNPAQQTAFDGPSGLLVTAIVVTAVGVPEPSSMAMVIGGGVFGLGALVRRRRRATA
jgi:hypothetical protein